MKRSLVPAALATIGTLALCVASTACHDEATGTTSTTGATAQRTVAAPNVDPATGQPAFTLNDGQIFEVLHTANQGEIAQARLAQEKASSPRVQRFAAMMLADHTEMDEKGGDLASKVGIPLSDSPTSLSVKMNGDHATSEMQSKTGADFDKAYIDAQVAEHQAVLDTIDQKLNPSAANDDLKSMLRTGRPKIAEHLEHAKRVQSELGESGGGDGTGGAKK